MTEVQLHEESCKPHLTIVSSFDALLKFGEYDAAVNSRVSDRYMHTAQGAAANSCHAKN